MSPVLITHISFLIGMFIFGFLIGRMKKQDVYERKITALESDKEHWRGIAMRQRTPPEVPDGR